jgi:hypothetical protein
MRVFVPLAALLFTTAAALPEAVPTPPAPASAPGRVASPDDPGKICRDRVHQVRRELGKPELGREAPAGDPLFIAAVDKRIGACSVLVMRGDTSDIRPLPAPGEHRLMPAQ